MPETERLVLRRFTAGDFDVIAELNADPEVMRHIGDGQPMSRDQVRAAELPRLTGYASEGARAMQQPGWTTCALVGTARQDKWAIVVGLGTQSVRARSPRVPLREYRSPPDILRVRPSNAEDRAEDCVVTSDSELADATSEDDFLGLTAGMAGLANLVAGASTLEQLLEQVASFAMLAVAGADGAGVTMLESGHTDTIVASATFVRDVDAIQYRLGEGPCISAAATGHTTTSPGLAEDAEWPNFGPLAADLGVHSALSLPLLLGGEVIGALNMYAHKPDAFGTSSRALGERFAGTAAVAIHNARALHRAQQTAVRLEAALTTRSTIDHAVGIIMSRSGVSADDAFVRLRIMSQHQHVKLASVAADIVEESVRRAKARARTPEESER